MINKIDFKPQFFYINGEYIVNRLFDDGTSISPAYFTVKEADLQKIYGLTEKEISEIPAYADYIMRPENNPQKYVREITLDDGLKYLNMYDLPLHPKGEHQANDYTTNWPSILKFLFHIAPNEKPFPTSRYTYIELMLDYLAIAWRSPKSNLPILALVSKERSTGKTTFLELIQLMFQTNAKLVTENDLDSEFNRFWGYANFILVDEAQIPKKLMNRIRSESTAKRRGIHEKYQTKSIIANFSKFVMASNDIDNFAFIDVEENRYFVIEVPPLPEDTEDSRILEVMHRELPHFLDYLMNRHRIQAGCNTRMTLKFEDYRTPALDKIMNRSKSSIYLRVEKSLQQLTENHSYDLANEQIWEFSITNFREWVQLDKGKEEQIKYALKKLGVQSTDNKKRFKCAFSNSNDVNAIKYSISVGQLRELFELNETADYADAC
jgi:hypothetical protein